MHATISTESFSDAHAIPSVDELQGLYRRTATGSSQQVALAVAEIERRIIDRRLVAGQRLIEADVAEDLGITTGRVREALRILAGDGMIELIPNRGARVSALNRTDLASMMEVLAGVLLTGVDIFGKRHGVPGPEIAEALEAASARITAAAEAGIPSAMLVRQTEFHVLINHLSGNSYLNFLVSRMNIAMYEKVAADTMSKPFIRSAGKAFAKAARLIIAGKSGLAHDHLQKHVNMFITYLREQG